MSAASCALRLPSATSHATARPPPGLSARFRAVRQALAAINAALSESIGGVRAIQLTRQAGRFDARFGELCSTHYRARMASLRLDAMMLRPLADVLMACSMAAVRSREQVQR